MDIKTVNLEIAKPIFKKVLLTLFVSATKSCNKDTSTQKTATTPTGVVAVSKISYTELLSSIKKKNTQARKEELFSFINNEIPTYWEGTPWSFNGTTRIPQSGSIACGYFITNVLTDFGYDIKRIYLAQQPSSVMIKQLCTDLKYFDSREKLKDFVKSKSKNQVYIVGLDFHTGFITFDGNNTYFIHSNYIKNQGVVKELATSSQALNASKTFMIGNLRF